MTDEKRTPGDTRRARTPAEKAAVREQSEKDRKTADEKRLADFKEARDRLRKVCNNRGNAKLYYPLFSPNWVSDMRRSEEEKPSEKQGKIQQDRLIWFDRNQVRLTLYDQLADAINHDATDRDYILNRYLGDYRYFRYAVTGREEAQYVSGWVRIETRDGRPTFKHWSHGLTPETHAPVHWGYVYRVESNLFFAGRAAGVLRLSIARTMRGTASSDYMPGLVLSMRSDTRDPFAARFLMVPCANKQLLAQLDPDLLGSREHFNQLAKANREPHYMILDAGNGQRPTE
ncbi:hypothetical protein [Sphingomonas soli]|uniref:hypothetical protein n=1 Tax=Sphingomonas soli TaxID=266127 RepID=UPI0008325F74|nr:hypothetical protein [Sphingomonas soli]